MGNGGLAPASQRNGFAPEGLPPGRDNSDSAIPKKLQEILNNEYQEKTGGGKAQEENNEVLYEFDSDKSSELTNDDVPTADKPFSLTAWLDTNPFPPSEGSMVLDCKAFTVDFLALDKKIDDNIRDICEKQFDKMVDLRPYMIENPEKVTRFDFLPKVLNRFRHMHLRHLLVVNPVNNNLEGVITR